MTAGTDVREPSATIVEEARGRAPSTLPRTIAAAALAVGVLDGTAAALFSPISAPRVFQYVASGLLGTRSFEGGTATVALGIALHLLVATAVASVYVLASRPLPLLVRRPLLCGPAYGAAVYFFMRHIVVPLSAISPPPFSFPAMLRGLTIHLVCVGLPAALVTRWLSPPHDGAEAR